MLSWSWAHIDPDELKPCDACGGYVEHGATWAPSATASHQVEPNRGNMSTRGSLEVKLPTTWTKEDQRRKESEERRCRCAKKKKSWNTLSPMICGSGESKSWLAKVAGAEPSGQMGTFRSQNTKKQVRTTLGRWSATYWVLGREVRFKSNMAQSTFRMALWREAHCEVKSVKKNGGVGPLFEATMRFREPAVDSAPYQKWVKRACFEAVARRRQAWDVWTGSAKMHFAWQAQYEGHVHQRG